MDVLEDRRKRARRLMQEATPRTHFKRTERIYVVIVYEENTEFPAAMELLADISKWFSVKAI